MSAETVTVRDTSSGRVHRRYRTESGRLASLEECNSDSSGAYSVLTATELVDVEADDLCGHCYPSITYNTLATTTTINGAADTTTINVD